MALSGVLFFLCLITDSLQKEVLGAFISNFNSSRPQRQVNNEDEFACTLPQHPENGQWTVEHGAGVPGGTISEHAIVKYKCNKGYMLSKSPYVACTKDWNLSSMPECKSHTCSFRDGSQGTCKYLTKCPSVLSLLDKGVYPETICGFEGAKFIVCCKNTATATTATTTTILAPTTTEAPNRLPGDISKEKCKQYAQYAYDRRESSTFTEVPHYSNVAECPYEKLKLIVGCTLATRNEFPHMALIGYQSKKYVLWGCGGSLISESFVLTAGHCLTDQRLGSPKLVWLGITNPTDTSQMQERSISKIITYAEPTTWYNDIGLIRLSEPADMNTYVRPACLQTETNIPFENAIASVWGRIEVDGGYSKDLQKIVLEMFNTQNCNKIYRRDINESNSALRNEILEDRIICTGSIADFTRLCQGGVPLQIYHEDTEDIKCMYSIVGVSSFAKRCRIAKNKPGIYTRVSEYLKWIEDNVWQ